MPQQTVASIRNFLFLLVTGVLARLLLVNATSVCEWLRNRLEISTPLTSWNRVLEGIYLRSRIGAAATYAGDLVHELPLMLRVYEALLAVFDVDYVFIVVDCLNAVLIYAIASRAIAYLYALEAADKKAGKYDKLLALEEPAQPASSISKSKFLLNEHSFNSTYWSLFTFGVYLFNPFGIASCVSQSTVVIHNFILLLWLFFLLRGQVFASFVFLALHANITVYSVTLLAASLSFLYQKSTYLSPKSAHSSCFTFVLKHSVLFFLLALAVFGTNCYMEAWSTRFIECTYLFVLQVPDLVPNMGLFWYFFTEMFDHFRVFFTYVFQLNAFIYAVPMTVRLRNDPLVNILLQVGLISVLKSYPSVGENGFYMSLLPMLAYLFPLMRNFLVYSCMLLAAVLLAPIMFYLWLGNGGGNANFYFAITLVYSIGQIFLIVDLFYAHLRREFIKLNGDAVPKNKDGSLAVFSLE